METKEEFLKNISYGITNLPDRKIVYIYYKNSDNCINTIDFSNNENFIKNNAFIESIHDLALETYFYKNSNNINANY